MFAVGSYILQWFISVHKCLGRIGEARISIFNSLGEAISSKLSSHYKTTALRTNENNTRKTSLLLVKDITKACKGTPIGDTKKGIRREQYRIQL